MSLPLLVYTTIHGTGIWAWLCRLVVSAVIGFLLYWGYFNFHSALAQNIIGGLMTSFVAIFLIWLYKEYKRYSPLYQFWNEILSRSKNESVEILVGYRQSGSSRNIGYGQAMSLPLIAEILRNMDIDWIDEKRVLVKYSNEELKPHTTSLVIG